MTEPSRTADESRGTEVGASGELDPTLARPSGAAPLAPGRNPLEPAFGPPEVPGEVGRIGRYRVLKKLGQGGMGAVYLGYDGTLGRKVALKVMLPQHAADPESRARFLREARAAAAVTSDHVVTIFDVGEEGGTAFIAMEYLLGSPLDQYLRTAGELPLAQVYRIAREVAVGLAAAHDLGLIHRDIKPGNVWLEAPKGRVKILDFGLARAQNDDTHLTTSGLVVGTPAYMSPEQARGHKLDGRSDLFSLGVMLYRLATGQMPFDGTTTMALLTSLAVDEPAPARAVKPDLPRALAAVIHKLLSKRPDGRYATAWEAAEALRRAEEAPAAEGESSVVDGAVPMAVPVQSGNVWEGLDESRERAASETEIVRPPSAAARAKPAAQKSRLVPALVAAALAVNLVAIAVVAVVLMVRPAKGTLVVETEDPDAELHVVKDGGEGRDGEVIRERTRDREIRLEPGHYTATLVGGKAGNHLAPDKFEVVSRRETRVVVRVARPYTITLQVPPPPPPPASPDRRAAEYVLSLGGSVQVNGASDDVRDPARLPKEPFTLTRVDLTGRPGVTDDGLARFKECKGVAELALASTAVTDAGLAHFKHCDLSALNLDATNTTDAGLAHFKHCKSLTLLRLHATGVTDAGLAPFAGATAVANLRLSETRVTDAGLAHFKGCRGLTNLIVYKTAIGDPGLAHFAGATALAELDLGETAATDAGVAHFKGCKSLILLSFPGAATDAAAAHFKGIAGLLILRVSYSQITAAGLANFKDSRGLELLRIEGTAIGDPGLAPFAGCPNLVAVDARGAKVTGAGLKLFVSATPRCRVTWDGGLIGPFKR